MLASLETRLSYQNFISGQEIYKDGQAKNGEEGKKQKYIKNLAMIYKKRPSFGQKRPSLTTLSMDGGIKK